MDLLDVNENVRLPEIENEKSGGESPEMDTSDSICDTKIKKGPRRTYRKKNRSNGECCVICGDRPTGYHYDVLSCNGCKIFYRRTVISGRSFICKRDGKCEFDKDMRCLCRACRFQKCVKAGMNKLAIQFPVSEADDTKPVIKKISKLSDALVRTADSPSTSSISTTSNDENNSEIIEKLYKFGNFTSDRWYKALKNLVYVEDCCEYLRVSNMPIREDCELSPLLRRPCVLNEAKKYQALDWPERLKNPFPNSPIWRRWFIMDFVLAIEYAKTFDAFCQLSDEDQDLLLRHTAAVVAFLCQAYTSYEANCGTTIMPNGMTVIDSAQYSDEKQLYEHFTEPVLVLRRTGIRREHYILLKAILLFSITVERLSDDGMKIIEAERTRLTLILHKLLINQLGPIDGVRTFGTILNMAEYFLRLKLKRCEFTRILEVFGKLEVKPLGRQLLVHRK